MSEYIEAFRKAWYNDQSREEIRYDKSTHAPIWENVWKMFAEWVENQNGYQLMEMGLKKRIQVTTNASDKGKSPRLTMEPWLFVRRNDASQSPICVKIVMCRGGIRVGVDFNEKEARKEKTTTACITAFKNCFSKQNENWQIENERFSIYNLIKYKQNVADETYKVDFIELLAKSIEQYEKVTDEFIEIKGKERPNSGKIEKNRSEADLFFFTLDKIDKGSITNDINGRINLCGAEYKGKQLFCCPANCENKHFCDALKWIRAGIVTAFSEHHDINSIKQYLDIGNDKKRHYKKAFQINGEYITIATNADASTVISDAIDAFDYFKENRSQFKVIFKYSNRDKDLKREYMEKLVGKDNILPYSGQLEKNTKEEVLEEQGDNILARNRIIFGAPGTGKSHQANLDANELLLGKPKKENKLDDADKKIKAARMERVTFHPEYSYFDFVGSYKPVMRNVPAIYVEGGISKTAKTEQGEKATERTIEYAFVPGPFTRILVKALKDDKHPYLLLIEEINRARVAAVFGDVFQLLDRTKGGESEYSICLSEDLREYLKEQDMPLNELKLPSNLYIWATMNSADQGVYPLDTAFKRRWSMEYLDIDTGKKVDNWNTIREGINNLLKPHVNEDKLMGYYFLKEEERDTEAHLEEALAGKVLMYLFDDAAKPCRKAVFKEINKARIYSDLREKMSLSESNLGIFTGSEFWPGQQEQRAGGNVQNETHTEEAETDVEQQ